MYLVIRCDTAYEPPGAGVADIVIKTGKRARTDEGIGRESVTPAVAVVPVAVGGRVVDRAVRVPPVRVLGRIEEGGVADDSAVGVVGACHDSLGADVKGEMLVEEVRSQAQVCCSSVVVGQAQGSLLEGIGQRGPVGHPGLVVAVDADGMVRRYGRTEDQFLPVCVGVLEEFRDLVTDFCPLRVDLPVEASEFRCCHDRYRTGIGLDAETAAVCYLRLASTAFFGRYEDDSVGGSRAVDGCCRRILQD